MRPVENDDIASFPFERRHATPQGSVERHQRKAYIRIGIVLGAVKGAMLASGFCRVNAPRFVGGVQRCRPQGRSRSGVR
jgi:hypothetical protein